ncbi:multicopper oxidase [Xylariaceae sp. FL0594]|nr:multicopper oxidase [Xylariaceae sp. FL0594]
MFLRLIFNMETIRHLPNLISKLSPAAQDGKSRWGTLLAPILPLWILSGGDSGGTAFLPAPWSVQGSGAGSPYAQRPNTAVTRKYEFNISRGIIAPDGYEKSVILVNGQFPGPLIEANWGDFIEVNVHNSIADEPQDGTTIHWHGFPQTDSPWEDGTPGVTQCPIPPGKSYRYKFRAELYGTSWYHSHYSAQYSDGLFGPIVVYGPTHAKYDVDLGPIMVNDWWHADYRKTVADVLSPASDGRATSDNNLINGRMNYDCDALLPPSDKAKCTSNAGLSKFKFIPGMTHRLRFINAGAEGTQRISIDEHVMTVIANDFVEVRPYETKVVTLGVGQRVDVLVKAKAFFPQQQKNARKGRGGAGAAYWLRSNLTSCAPARQPYALAAIYYYSTTAAAAADDAQKMDNNNLPDSAPWDVPDPGTCANDDLGVTVPLYPVPLPEPSWTETRDIAMYRNETGSVLWTFGGVAGRINYDEPTILQVRDGNLTFSPEMNIVDYGHNPSVRFIINNPTPAAHPIHAHGREMYILSSGPGSYSYNNNNNKTESVVPIPMRRDVHLVPPFGHAVLQIDAGPGLWPLHCHVAWHASAGFFSQMLFRPDMLLSGKGNEGEVDAEGVETELEWLRKVKRNCRDWNAFTRRVGLGQLDSGL